MDKKRSMDLSEANHPKRKRPQGNQRTVKKNVDIPGTSGEKLQHKENLDIITSSTHGYCILNFFAVFSTIASLVTCKKCKGEIAFSQATKRGLGFKIAIQCKCGAQYVNSCPIIEKTYEVNQRIVLVMRLLGISRKRINLFCGLMDLCQELSTEIYYACLKNIHSASSAVYNSIVSRAVEEEKKKNEKAGNLSVHLTVSGDRTWKQQGFSSSFGVCALIGKYSKKVLDTVVKSSFCQDCNLWEIRKEGTIDDYNDWYENHKRQCMKIINDSNHVSADKMAVDAITEMFQNSEEKYRVKYTTYIGGGDSKTFQSILDAKPYGDTVVVKRKECVRYVEKRMSTRLYNVRKTIKDLGGEEEGKLSDKIISELTKYYGLAIRRHSNSLSEMRRAVWATFYHKSSTNENPQHSYCPSGTTSWCKWRQAEAIGKEKEFIHERPPLADNVLTAIKPIYDDLSSDELLERCLEAETRNSSESLKSLIWLFTPKHRHLRLKAIEIATFLAVNIFNEGFSSILRIFNTLGIVIGQQTEVYVNLLESRESSHIESSKNLFSEIVQRTRSTSTEELPALQDFYEYEEGPLWTWTDPIHFSNNQEYRNYELNAT